MNIEALAVENTLSTVVSKATECLIRGDTAINDWQVE